MTFTQWMENVHTHEPDGYMVTHGGQNFTADFGPFTLAEARAFVKAQGFGLIVALFKTVDWNRDSDLRRGRAHIR